MMMKMATKMFLAVLLFQLLIQSTGARNVKNAETQTDKKNVKNAETQTDKKNVKNAETQTFKYGDILAFHRKILSRFTITHFAVYIDNIATRFPGQTGDLFHITGPFPKKCRLSDCVFGKMTDEIKSTLKVQNYLDEMTGLTVPINIGSDADITRRINELLQECPTWLPLNQNCEHLATYIRYGIHVSIQLGGSVEGWCRPFFTEADKLSQADETSVISKLHKLYDGKDDKEFYTLMSTSAQPCQAAAAPSG